MVFDKYGSIRSQWSTTHIQDNMIHDFMMNPNGVNAWACEPSCVNMLAFVAVLACVITLAWCWCISLCYCEVSWRVEYVWEYKAGSVGGGGEQMLMKFEERWHVVIPSGSWGRKYAKLYCILHFTVSHTFHPLFHRILSFFLVKICMHVKYQYISISVQ